jgi:radical SAM superfamily enzyme YgiQ (UPF0313 family)
MKPRILLVNPPIYDFSAFDFWLKPYGMLRAAGLLRGQAEFRLFDYLDRFDPQVPAGRYRCDELGRGQFYSEPVAKPNIFSRLPRRFKRFGMPRAVFQEFLAGEEPFDYALVQTGMTYWYLGVREVIEDLRRFSRKTKIVLGGVYATLCPVHARALGADLVVEGVGLDSLWNFLDMTPASDQLPFWDLYPRLETGVLKLADGCPFRCTYCSVPQVYPEFHSRSLTHSIAELEFLVGLGVKHVAFYDDALLYRPQRILIPFLNEVLRKQIHVNFHTPNALNARFIYRELALLMITAGFTTIFLGFESSSYAWQMKTGGKVYAGELARAVEHFFQAGATTSQLHAYIIFGHPMDDEQQVEKSMRLAHSLGIRPMLSEFSPIPGTPDGEFCRRWVDLDEPLWHNKTAYTALRLGQYESQRLKHLATDLNQDFNNMATSDKVNSEFAIRPRSFARS